MISIHKKLGLLFATAFCVVLVAGCNETLRQFIVPVPRPTGDPSALAHAVVLSTNGLTNDGSTMHIDVSGDSIAGVVETGPNPVFLGKDGSRAYVINSDDTVTSYFALLPTTPPINTVTLPSSGTNAAVAPVAGATTSSGNIFLANSGSNTVGVISGTVLAQTTTIAFPATSHKPVAIAGSPISSKMYIVNNLSNDVTVVSTTDNSSVKTIPVGSHPIWGVMANNGVQVFIVNQGDGTAANPGSVSVIDTNLDIVIPCTPGPACSATGAISAGTTPATSAPTFAFYDAKLQRLYVTNTGEGTLTVIKADGIDLGVTPQVLPGLLANIKLSAAPTSVVPLSDGPKASAALLGRPAATNHITLPSNLGSCNGSLVSVIDAIGLQEVKTIPVGAGAVSIDAASDASRVYVVSAHASNVSIIRTSTDSGNTTFTTPQQRSSCTSTCPEQTPFMVHLFPYCR